MRKTIWIGAVALLLALAGAVGLSRTAMAGPSACENRNNNTHAKLLECVTLEGVREHQAALQAIADANGGTRAAGTPGYDASLAYVKARMEAAGSTAKTSTPPSACWITTLQGSMTPTCGSIFRASWAMTGLQAPRMR